MDLVWVYDGIFLGSDSDDLTFVRVKLHQPYVTWQTALLNCPRVGRIWYIGREGIPVDDSPGAKVHSVKNPDHFAEEEEEPVFLNGL